MKTNRQAHEEAAGMGLDPAFFTHAGIDPNAPSSLERLKFEEIDDETKSALRAYQIVKPIQKLTTDGVWMDCSGLQPYTNIENMAECGVKFRVTRLPQP